MLLTSPLFPLGLLENNDITLVQLSTNILNTTDPIRYGYEYKTYNRYIDDVPCLRYSLVEDTVFTIVPHTVDDIPLKVYRDVLEVSLLNPTLKENESIDFGIVLVGSFELLTNYFEFECIPNTLRFIYSANSKESRYDLHIDHVSTRYARARSNSFVFKNLHCSHGFSSGNNNTHCFNEHKDAGVRTRLQLLKAASMYVRKSLLSLKNVKTDYHSQYNKRPNKVVNYV